MEKDPLQEILAKEERLRKKKKMIVKANYAEVGRIFGKALGYKTAGEYVGKVDFDLLKRYAKEAGVLYREQQSTTKVR